MSQDQQPYPPQPYQQAPTHQPYQQAPHQVIYQQVVRQPTNGQATGSLVLGIVAAFFGITVPIPIWGLFMVFLAGPAAIVAVILGHLGLNTAKRMGAGRAAALTGLILGYIVLGIIVLTFVFWIAAYIIGAASDRSS